MFYNGKFENELFIKHLKNWNLFFSYALFIYKLEMFYKLGKNCEKLTSLWPFKEEGRTEAPLAWPHNVSVINDLSVIPALHLSTCALIQDYQKHFQMSNTNKKSSW